MKHPSLPRDDARIYLPYEVRKSFTTFRRIGSKFEKSFWRLSIFTASTTALHHRRDL
jgi:hypothetical protein